MKKILVIVMLIFAFGCSDNATEPSEATIVGKWTRFYNNQKDDEDITMLIEFTADGKYIVRDEMKLNDDPIIEGTYNYVSNIILMTDENCDDIVGKYELVFRNNGVEFKLKEDECDRNEFMPGFFNKYVVTTWE